MAEIGNSFIFPNPRDRQETDFYSTTQDFVRQVIKILNRGIRFTDNVDCRSISLTTSGTPDASNTIAHTLGKIPIGYIVVYQNKAASLYDGGTTWTDTNIYLKSNVATVNFRIIVF